MVAYTDGGARPNPGAVGSGLFGYLYEVTEPEKAKPLKFTDGEVIKYAYPAATGFVYCSRDGTPTSNGRRSGEPVKPEYFIEIAQSFSGQYSNNFAELNALYNAIRVAREHGVKKLHIVSDSNYALNTCSVWALKWKANNWVKVDGGEIKNLDLVKALHEDYNKAIAEGIVFTFEWIKGHRGHPGNMEADDMATIGVLKSRHGIDDGTTYYFKPKDYTEPKRDRHPLMSLKRMYINRERERNTPGLYMMADPGKDDNLIGKPISEAVFSIIKMKEPVELIESILDAQGRYLQDFNITMMIKMDDVYTPDAFRTITAHGEHCMYKDIKRSNVVLPGNRPMTIERTPVGITMRAIDAINGLETIMTHHAGLVDGTITEESNHLQMKIHDLTPELYSTVESRSPKDNGTKTVFTSDIAVGQKDLSIKLELDDKEISMLLKLGLDIPDRNALKRLETSNPTVHVITWRDSSVSFRYASVISCDEGCAIWSNYYADRLFPKKPS